MTILLFATCTFSAAASDKQQPQTSATSAVASKKPTGFRDIKWGAAEAEVRQKLNLDGEYDCMDMQGKRHCSTSFDIGDARVTAFLYFDNDQFGQVLMWFPSDEFDLVKSVFVDKYGQASASKVQEVRTRMNVAFQNAVLTWRWSDVDIFFEKYGPDVEQGFASITTRKYAAAEAQRERDKKRVAKDAF